VAGGARNDEEAAGTSEEDGRGRRDPGRPKAFLVNMNTFYIYALFYRGVPYYLGKGHKKRLHSHERYAHKGNSHKDRLVSSLLKKKKFEKPILIAEGLSEQEAFDLEVLLIHLIGRKPNGPLLNMTNGGEGGAGRVLSKKTKKRIQQSLLGRKHTKAACEKMKKTREQRAAIQARMLLPEQRKRMSRLQKQRWADPAYRQRMIEARQRYLLSLHPHRPYPVDAQRSGSGDTEVDAPPPDEGAAVSNPDPDRAPVAQACHPQPGATGSGPVRRGGGWKWVLAWVRRPALLRC
jgi:hypothetical protein